MNKKGFSNILLLVLVFIVAGMIAAWHLMLTKKAVLPDQQSMPSSCADISGGVPVITSLSKYSGSVGMTIEISGCNFNGFEGDLNIWVENTQGIKGIAYSEASSTSKLMKIVLQSSLCQTDNSYSGLPCKSYIDLVPGIYKIYMTPWGNKSNEINFTIN